MKKKPFKITAEGLKKLLAELAELPPKPKSEYSAREMLAEAEVEIRNALAIGYDLQDIAKIVGKHGEEINAGTLSSCLRELQTKHRGKPTKRKTKADPADTISIVKAVSEDTPSSTPTEMGSTHADTKSALEREEADITQLPEQIKPDPDS